MTEENNSEKDLRNGRIAAFSLAVVGLARNCERTICDDIHTIMNATHSAKSVVWLIVESDSSDRTLDELGKLKAEIKSFHYISLGKLSNQLPKRTDRISHCRNYYAEQLRKNSIFSEVDYVAVVDLDGVNEKLTRSAFESCWSRDDWDMCAANQNGPYYDIWALRHKDWCPGDCWAQFNFLNLYSNNRERNLWASILSKMITIPKESDWIEVDSAFGGLAVYKKAAFHDCEYVGVTESGEELCEHVHFHRRLREKGMKLFINPQLVNAELTEHSATLFWKSRIRRVFRSTAKALLIRAIGADYLNKIRSSLLRLSL